MIYQYRCSQCQLLFDVTTTLEKRNVVQECPNCKTITGRRQITAPMFDTGGTTSQKLARLGPDLKYVSNYKDHA